MSDRYPDDQRDLFGEQAHARRTDPETSHEAAVSLTTDHIRASQEAVLSVFRDSGIHGLTDEELLRRYRGYRMLLKQSDSGLRTRRAELVRMGKLRDSGKRSTTVSNRKTIIWEVAS